MKRVFITLLTLSTLLLARNDVPSCYKALNMKNPNTGVEKELFILIDQTTIIDKNMMKYTYKNMMNFMQNGYAVSIASFSSNSNGKYTDIAYSGSIENLLTENDKHDTSKKLLRKYDACMKGQVNFAKKKAKKALVKVLKGASKKMPYSEIVKSLSTISKNIITNSKANEKVVLLVSDMIEHSTITSFYTKNTLKNVNAKSEMNKVTKRGFIADFDNAKIYVIGTGVLGKKGHRNANTLTALQSFWKSYFQASNANLIEMGTPMLLREVE